LSRVLFVSTHRNTQLAARCSKLEAQKAALEGDKAELRSRLDKAQARLLSGAVGLRVR
jgi:hypothetical protein